MQEITALSIPEQESELADWLEACLISDRLGLLVAELSAIEPSRMEAGPASELSDDDRQEILRSGLSSLSADRLRGLLRQPASLLELQGDVLAEGGDYWEHRIAAGDSISTDGSWHRIEQRIAGTNGANTTAEFANTAQRPDAVPVKPSITSSRRLPAIIAAAAAVLVIAVFIQDRTATTNVQVAAVWGWERPDVYKADVGAKQYLDRLADSAAEWFRKRPETRDHVTVRIAEFRRGCDALLAAAHEPLTEADRSFLAEQCRQWSAEFDAQLAKLKSGDDPKDVRAEADELVRTLIETLRERADGIA